MSTKLPTYYVSFTDDSEKIEFISLVEQPAIEINWKAFSKIVQQIQFKQIGDQKKLAGPFAIPDMPIYRHDEELGEYNLVFSKETIQKMADKFNAQSLSQNINLEHAPDSKVPGAFVAENWIVDAPDKSKKYGFNLPDGAWFGVVKIDNEAFWNDYVKEKKILGFSIEGMLGVTTKKMNTMNTEQKLADAPVVPATPDATAPTVPAKPAAPSTAKPSAPKYNEFPLLDGSSLFCTDKLIALESVLYTDATGATVAPDAEYVTADNITITVLAGKVQGLETKAVEDAEPAKPGDTAATMAANAGVELAAYPWDQCIADAMAKYGDMQIAERVCGAIKEQNMAAAPVVPAVEAPAKPADVAPPAMDAMLKDVLGQIAVLTDRVQALEDALTSANGVNEELNKKVETLSKLPGATSITKEAKLATEKKSLVVKKDTFQEQLNKLKIFVGQK